MAYREITIPEGNQLYFIDWIRVKNGWEDKLVDFRDYVERSTNNWVRSRVGHKQELDLEMRASWTLENPKPISIGELVPLIEEEKDEDDFSLRENYVFDLKGSRENVPKLFPNLYYIKTAELVEKMLKEFYGCQVAFHIPTEENSYRTFMRKIYNPTILKYEKGDYFDKHRDRKRDDLHIGSCLFLPPKSLLGDLEGGDLLIYQDENSDSIKINYDEKSWKCITFPLRTFHSVTPVVSGIKYTIKLNVYRRDEDYETEPDSDYDGAD